MGLILRIVGSCALGIFILLILSLFILSEIDEKKKDDYCLGLYPSKISEPSVWGNSWSEYHNVENGYIRCCRYYYENHEREKR